MFHPFLLLNNQWSSVVNKKLKTMSVAVTVVYNCFNLLKNNRLNKRLREAHGVRKYLGKPFIY